MKSYSTLLAILAILGASPLGTSAQVTVTPNTLSGTLRFNNTDPAILGLLNAPGEEGMTNVFVTARSVAPAPPQSATTDLLPALGLTSTPYAITVDSDPAGIAYAVRPRVGIQRNQQYYYFTDRISPPVTPGAITAALDFTECVGVVTLRFITPVGDLANVNDGRVFAHEIPGNRWSGELYSIPEGATQQRLYLLGGVTHRLDITLHLGADVYTDRLTYALTTNVAVACDGFTTVDVVLPDAGSLGTIIGEVDLVGEFELTVEGRDDIPIPDSTAIIANSGPFENQRWDTILGTHFTVPSSGAYSLGNLMPSPLDPASNGYSVYATMFVRTNRMIQYFRTPALGRGSNARVAVPAGAVVNLGDTFVIEPGYMQGSLLLQGPAESLGRSSLLRGIRHAVDTDADGDTVPDLLGTYVLHDSRVMYEGVNRLAPGAAYTATFGHGAVDFDGLFDPARSAFDGGYELALGGLNSEPSIWRYRGMHVFLTSGNVVDDNDYFYSAVTINNTSTNDHLIVSSATNTHDLAYCFSEVRLVFRSDSDTFYDPQVRFSPGAFSGTDFQGHDAKYTVSVDPIYGTPRTSITASNYGRLTMYLPQGTYTLRPSVVVSGSTLGTTGLDPIVITVGCGQRIDLETCLQLDLEAPECATTPITRISGSVRSCSNDVARIGYTLNGGPSVPVCTDCGPNPVFDFDIALAGPCSENVLEVTAVDVDGGVSSVATTIRYDAAPPVMQCPGDMVFDCVDGEGVVVEYQIYAEDDCDGAVVVECDPPSGSVFPLGETTVVCRATDACGNTTECRFTVTVGGTGLAIERAVCVRWKCLGTLQWAQEITGPWFDLPGATSPYYAPASEAARFYRVSN